MVPDGHICTGGQSKFKGFDLARDDWQTAPWSPDVDGSYQFRYYATAPHRTLDWKFYLTRDGWAPGQRPLQWSDLELASTVAADQVVARPDKRYVMRLNLPHRTGRHVLFAVWQRADSQEAFYSCSDVSFGGETSTSPPQSRAPCVRSGKPAQHKTCRQTPA